MRGYAFSYARVRAWARGRVGGNENRSQSMSICVLICSDAINTPYVVSNYNY